MKTNDKKEPYADNQRQLAYKREKLIVSIERDLKNIEEQLSKLREVRKLLKTDLHSWEEASVGDCL